MFPEIDFPLYYSRLICFIQDMHYAEFAEDEV